MDSPNVELVRSIVADWERGDWSSAEWADPEIELIYADGPSPGRWTGLVGIAEGTRDAISVWEDFRIAVDGYRELDDERVLVPFRFSGRGKTSGLEIGELHAKGAYLFHLRDRKISRVVIYWDREHALTDLGLPEETDSPRP
jgi:ketosteroid isomerase-like protein